MPHHDVEPLALAGIPVTAGLDAGDLLRYLPLLLKLLSAAESGTGSFNTRTPWGKRWVTVSDHAPEGMS